MTCHSLKVIRYLVDIEMDHRFTRGPLVMRWKENKKYCSRLESRDGLGNDLQDILFTQGGILSRSQELNCRFARGPVDTR